MHGWNRWARMGYETKSEKFKNSFARECYLPGGNDGWN